MFNFSEHAHPTRFASQFGGLWTDLSNAEDIVAGRLALNTITADEAALLRFWIANGYVILPSVVSRAQIEKVNREITRLYDNGIGYVETWDEAGNPHVGRLEARHRNMAHKLIDGYAGSPVIRDVAMSDRVVRFMTMIFDSPALMFQGLYFEYGSQQPVHQDAAYVHVSRPMELAASWLALEDVAPGSGELEYYPGSHRIPEFVFDGNGKWLQMDGREREAYVNHLATQFDQLGLKKERFAAKAGDVLIWSADLAHGGSPITNPHTTRRSYVSHWCPVTAAPGYFVYARNSGKIKVSDRASYSYSFHAQTEDPYQAHAAAPARRKFWPWQW